MGEKVTPRRVYPVEGKWLMGVPHVSHICDDAECVASGAFTTVDPDKPKASKAPKGRPKKASEPPPAEADQPDDATGDGGVSDSTEA